MTQRLEFSLPHGAFGMFGKCARGVWKGNAASEKSPLRVPWFW